MKIPMEQSGTRQYITCLPISKISFPEPSNPKAHLLRGTLPKHLLIHEQFNLRINPFTLTCFVKKKQCPATIRIIRHDGALPVTVSLSFNKIYVRV